MAPSHYFKLTVLLVITNVQHIFSQTAEDTIHLTLDEHFSDQPSVDQRDHVTICINVTITPSVPLPQNASIFRILNVNEAPERTIGIRSTETPGLYKLVECHPVCTRLRSTIRLVPEHWRTIKFILPEAVRSRDRIKISCENIVCKTISPCKSGEETLVRKKRQVAEVNDNNVTVHSVTESTLATNQTEESDTPASGLSKGALAAAIVVPILILILAGVGGYFLYRWLRSRRTEHGVYQPKAMENQGNFSKQPDPQSVIKLPPEERLI